MPGRFKSTLNPNTRTHCTLRYSLALLPTRRSQVDRNWKRRLCSANNTQEEEEEEGKEEEEEVNGVGP